MNPRSRHNLLNNALAAQEANARRLRSDHANYRGELTECTTANLFIVRDAAAVPHRSNPGCSRDYTGILFDVGKEVGVDVRGRCFETAISSLPMSVPHQHHREVVPIVSVDDRRLETAAGTGDEKLLEGFRRRAHAD